MRAINSLTGLACATVLFSFATASFGAEGTWQSLFDGKSLEGWKAADHDECFRVEDGAIVAGGGPMAHLFYVGPVGNHDFGASGSSCCRIDLAADCASDGNH